MNTEIMCFADFKALEQYPVKCRVWANASLRATIIDFAVSKGYYRAGESGISYDASILYFSRRDTAALRAGQDFTVADLLGLYSRANKHVKPFDVDQVRLICAFAKMLRVLTVEETIKSQIDGTQRPDENIIIIPSNISIT